MDASKPSQDMVETGILTLLTGDEDQRPRHFDELARAYGRLLVEDSVRQLHADGLVHSTADGLIFPTRAAVRGREIEW
jgi:hypothetical protein